MSKPTALAVPSNAGGWLKMGLAALFITMVVLAGTGVYKKYVASSAIGEKIGLNEKMTEEKMQEVAQITQKDRDSCDGIASVKALYNDEDAFKRGTDPNTNMTIYAVELKGEDGKVTEEKFSKQVNDDATSTTVPILRKFKALAGNTLGAPSTTYFASLVEFSTVCSDKDIQPQLYKAGAPTITAVEDDGVTKFSDSNKETVTTSTSYVVEYTVRSPSELCSAVQGAVFACEYDASYIQKVEVDAGDITTSQTSIYTPHITRGNATYDQWQTFVWKDEDGMLCNGAKDTFSLKYTTTSASCPTCTDSAHSISCKWYPNNIDLDADKLTPITGIYDEDNNAIYPVSVMVNTTTTV